MAIRGNGWVSAAGPGRAGLVCLLAMGCAGPGPTLLPAVPAKIEPAAGGATLQWYDTNGDARLDYAEEVGADGRVGKLRYSTGKAIEEVDLRAIPPGERRDLVLILDSVPFAMVQQAWRHGGFQFFPRPTRTIAPFPVLTDPCLVDFFHLLPGVAIESDYYDGKGQTRPYDVYLGGGVAVWHPRVDYWLSHTAHGSAYLDQLPWFDHELRRIQDGFDRSGKTTFIGYCVGTSALGALRGWDGHAIGISRVDRFCHAMMFRTRGRLRITLLSDHGHNNVPASRRIPLTDLLREMGYRITDRLQAPGDLVVPEFAMVSSAAIYTRTPAPVARAVVQIEGIELSAYREADDGIVVLSRDGEARVRKSPGGYRYEVGMGDPLRLTPILDRLKQQGRIEPDGCFADAVLLEATRDHIYPDAVDRLWRTFHEQFKHPPDVLISVQDGYHCGSAFQTRAVGALKAVHGNLGPLSSSGFAMTTAGELPEVLRMRDLADALAGLGMDLQR
ncbi:MAG: hypothetical protein HY718_12835 [Planctomycetes bacterium]|nr:hypothetical protein [Planctomycetota bacterium]